MNGRVSSLKPHDAARRSFLSTSAFGAASLLLTTSRADAAQRSDTEQADLKVVNEFCAAVSTRDLSRVQPFFAADVVYRMTETAPLITGHEALAASFKKYVENADRVEFRVLETFAVGPIVLNHRVDTFAFKQTVTVEVVGVFFVTDGKIKEWSDYIIKETKT
jgi:limonene-1,2-epoxide hydrolase